MTRRSWDVENAKHFGAIIRRLRLDRHLSMRQLAQQAAINDRHISVLERGANTPTLQTVFDLADALRVNAADIVAEVDAARRRS